ncbi:MAG TPA: HAMP domain-containing sensor histidine kinase [Pyrinomonadaceae bacterium]|nr:HAMP domain-containing sensor histidine kinase [Pyrinomonadaceae bacterium]
MNQDFKTEQGASVSSAGAGGTAFGAEAARAPAREPDGVELHALSAEIVGLLNEQAFSTGEPRTEREVCESFADILLRRWSLCCVAIFLRDGGGSMKLCASYGHGRVDESAAREMYEALAAEVERTGGDFRLDTGGMSALQESYARAGMADAAGVPIEVGGALSGVIVIASEDAGRLGGALSGVRCVGQAVFIALGNARRAAAMSEQRRQIESLVKELRSRTAELEGANLELQRVGRYRSLFLERMSHELRTPLTSILGFAEIMLDQEDLTETQRRFCGKIQSSGFQLQASLNQLVDLSRLEAGKTELFLHEFSLRETLRESCAAVLRLAQKQDVKLECATDASVVSIVSDEGKLRQVLYNFLAFAIGRSPAGGNVRVQASAKEGARVRVEITDEGEPLEDPARLFEPVDIDAPNERGTNMNELGLVIAHRLLGVLGGEVTLHDLEPAGLSIHLNLPSRPTENGKQYRGR